MAKSFKPCPSVDCREQNKVSSALTKAQRVKLIRMTFLIIQLHCPLADQNDVLLRATDLAIFALLDVLLN